MMGADIAQLSALRKCHPHSGDRNGEGGQAVQPAALSEFTEISLSVLVICMC